MKRVFIVHGWGGNPEEAWFPWLKQELEEKGFEVFAPAMPNTDYPQLEEWLKTLSETVGTPSKNDYFVGHSLGCITILRYIELLDKGEEIGGAIFVAGFTDAKIGALNSIQEIQTFFTKDLDFEKVKSHCNKFVAIHSDNDEYVSTAYSDIFREKLGAKTTIIHSMGHFSGSAELFEFPKVLDLITKMSKQNEK